MPRKAGSSEFIKGPNVSGQFYTADPDELSNEIDAYLSKADLSPAAHPNQIVIVPHAGYMYSGPVAAYGFKALSEKKYTTIVILAPSHFYGFDGISVWPEGGFQTPLGVVSVDSEFSNQLIGSDDKISFDRQAFDKEHSLEVELPFIQKTFKDTKIVPVIFGQPSLTLLSKFAARLKEMIGNREDILIVVSTDLSHYHPYDEAKVLDAQALEAVKNLKVEQIWNECHARIMEMCGCIPVIASLIYARLQGLDHVEVLRYANSGDVTGDKSRVVGYSSVLIYKEKESTAEKIKAKDNKSSFTLEQKKKLLSIARETLTSYIEKKLVPVLNETDPRLLEEEGAFVTYHKKGNLRGCIGNVLGSGPLYKTVRDMAVEAAIHDPRFDPVTKEEIKDLQIEISVLSKPRRITNVDEIELGVHGVIVHKGKFNHGLFLPQVATQTGWSREEFLSQLCAQKAGLSPDAWKDPDTVIEIFTADVFSEADLH